MNLWIHRHRFLIALVLCTVLGLALRSALVVTSGWRIDYDEAMVGLTALRMMRGQHGAFLPAQVALGAGEAYLLAPLFTIFGISTVVFRLYSLACAGALIVTTGLVGRCAFGTRVGALAGLIAAVAPPYALIASLKTWGATVETMILGHLIFVAIYGAITTAGRSRQRRLWMMGAGIAAGLSFWMAWLGLYYFIVVGIVLLVFGRRVVRDPWAIGIGLIAFFVASMPFWAFNATNDWATFAHVINDRRMNGDEIRAVLSHFAHTLLPQLVTGDTHWEIVGRFWTGVLLLAYGSGVLALWTFVARRRDAGSSMRWMLALLTVIIPVVYAFSTQSRNALNPFGIDATGRYVVMLHSVLPVGLASLALIPVILKRFQQPILVGITVIALVLALNLAGFAQLNPHKAFDSPYYDRLPDQMDLLIKALAEEDVRYVWTDVGLGQVLMFETQERVLAADWYDAAIAQGPVRFPEVLKAVENAPYAAYLVPVAPDQGAEDIRLLQAFNKAEISYRTLWIESAPPLLLILPDEQVSPEVVAEGLGYQY